MKKLLLALLVALCTGATLSAQEMKLVATIEYNRTQFENYQYTLSFNTTEAKTINVGVDWGNGNMLTYSLNCNGQYGEDRFPSIYQSASATLAGATVKVYTQNPEDIAMFYIDHSYSVQAIPQSIDVSQLTNLRTLLIGKANLTNGLDLSANTELMNLNCINNGLKALDLTNNKKLKRLEASGNSFGDNLNLTQCGELKNLLVVGSIMGSKAVTSLDLTNNTKLEVVTCYLNKIETLDLSNAPLLRSLNCHTSQVKSLTINSTAVLTDLTCNSNDLTFNTMSSISQTISGTGNYIYDRQASILLETAYAPNTSIDLSNTGAEFYVWKKASDKSVLAEGVDYTIASGITQFKHAIDGNIYCEMTNSLFPLLTLTSTQTTISGGTSINQNQATTKIVGEAGAIRIVADNQTGYTVYTTSGTAIANGTAQGETTIGAAQGIYIVKIGETTQKVIVK